MSKSNRAIKLVSAIMAFLLVFIVIQNIMIPKHMKASTLSVEGFEKLDSNTLDVLFLGASQMFCTINSKLMFDEYGIYTYGLGASSQVLPATKYYLEYALQTQRPKRVFVEVSSIFYNEDYITDEMMSWSYAPMRMDHLKWDSVYELTGQDYPKTIGYCIFPLFVYHSRWNSMGPQDLQYYFSKRDYSNRGFVGIESNQVVSFVYGDLSCNEIKAVPQMNFKALEAMIDICRENDICLTLFKSPVPDWTVGDFRSVKALADELDVEFIDLNQYIEQIGIDPNTDYANDNHLNFHGAEKVTRFFTEAILQTH